MGAKDVAVLRDGAEVRVPVSQLALLAFRFDQARVVAGRVGIGHRLGIRQRLELQDRGGIGLRFRLLGQGQLEPERRDGIVRLYGREKYNRPPSATTRRSRSAWRRNSRLNSTVPAG